MSFPSKYTALGLVLIAVVFLLVNAGFTSVLHSCLMVDKACCEAMLTGGAMTPDAAIPPSLPAFNHTGSACCENAIMGGLWGISALSESKGNNQVQKSTPLHDVTGPYSPILRPTAPSSHYFITQHPASPPSREIFILTSALLI